MLKPGWAQKSFEKAKSEVEKLSPSLRREIEAQKNGAGAQGTSKADNNVSEPGRKPTVTAGKSRSS